MEISREQAIEEIKNGTEIGDAIIEIERGAIIQSLKYLREKHFGTETEAKGEQETETKTR